MILIDANAILRLILSDNMEMEKAVKNLIKENPVLIKNEVMAEIIYVLEKVYKVSRKEVCQCLLSLLKVENIFVENKDMILFAIESFDDKNIDFVDSLLYAYHTINGMEIFTFDKKLKKLINE